MKICLYGSSSKKTLEKYTDVGYDLGLRIAENGHTLIFGGGNDGMMGAVASGVYSAGGNIVSIAPHWIGEFDDPFKNSDKHIETRSMVERKALFMENADAFIISPGGLGTLDEFFDVLILKYLKRHTKPVILLSIDNYYDGLISTLKDMKEQFMIREDVFEYFEIAHTVDEVFHFLEE